MKTLLAIVIMSGAAIVVTIIKHDAAQLVLFIGYLVFLGLLYAWPWIRPVIDDLLWYLWWFLVLIIYRDDIRNQRPKKRRQ